MEITAAKIQGVEVKHMKTRIDQSVLSQLVVELNSMFCQTRYHKYTCAIFQLFQLDEPQPMIQPTLQYINPFDL